MEVIKIVAYVMAFYSIIKHGISDFQVHWIIWGGIKRRLIFSYPRVERETRKLQKKVTKGASAFNPHVIVGVGGQTLSGSNRFGGAIVGLQLASAKRLDKSFVYIDYLRYEEPRDATVVESHNSQACESLASEILSLIPPSQQKGRILIVEDWCQTGATVSDVVKKLSAHLEQKDPTKKFQIAVATIVKKKKTALDTEHKENSPLCFSCYVYDKSVQFPWHA